MPVGPIYDLFSIGLTVKVVYSQTCLKRSPVGESASVNLIQLDPIHGSLVIIILVAIVVWSVYVCNVITFFLYSQTSRKRTPSGPEKGAAYERCSLMGGYKCSVCM